MLTDFQIVKSLYELQNLGYHLIRINAGKTDFNDYEEFGRVNSYIAESTKKQTKKSLIDDLSKGLLELKWNHSTKSNCLKWIVEKILPDYKEWKTLNQK